MSSTYTVTAVSDWRVTVLEDRGAGHTTIWEIPLAWVDGPIVGEPLRGVVYFKPTPPLVAEAMSALHDRTVFGAGFMHCGTRIDPDRMLIDQTSGAYVMKEAAPKVAQPADMQVYDAIAANYSTQPLTDEQKRVMWRYCKRAHAVSSSFDWYSAGVEDGERAHGIGQEGGAA